MSSKKSVIAIVILLVTLLIVFAITSTTEAPIELFEEGEDQITEDLTLNYTNTGFLPENLTISVGDTVEFYNKSDNLMWVASDPHPSHTDYPEFDQNEPEDYFTFTFNETGEWAFHNHLVPSHTGTVKVE